MQAMRIQVRFLLISSAWVQRDRSCRFQVVQLMMVTEHSHE